jgi:hypothetical protein
MKTVMVLSVMFLVACTDNKQATVTAKDGINGKDGQSIVGERGAQGLAGTSCSTEQLSNGVKIKCGETESILLNGAAGAAGSPGQSIVGPMGQPGASGKNAVIKQYSATTAQCANGGIVLDTFTDMNSNNTYESNVDTNYQRTVLCNQVSSCEDKKESDNEHEDEDKKDDKSEDEKEN